MVIYIDIFSQLVSRIEIFQIIIRFDLNWRQFQPKMIENMQKLQKSILAWNDQ